MLYMLSILRRRAFLASKTGDIDLWHRRMGHLSIDAFKKLANGMVEDLDIDSNRAPDFCKACLQGKQHRIPFPTSGATRATDILEIVHSDVCGPMSKTSLGKTRYFLTFIDDKSRMTFVYFLRSKDEVFTKFKEFKSLVENQTGKRIKTLRSDNGGEYTSHNFQRYLKAQGILHQKTAPYTPEQNGVAERANRTIVEKARCMLQEYGMNHEFWAEAVNTAVYLKNRSPTQALSNSTPFEAWSGKKPNVAHLRPFGCKAYAHIPIQKRRKLDSKTIEGIFVGYCGHSKAYRVYDPVRQASFYYSRRGIQREGRQRQYRVYSQFERSGRDHPCKTKQGKDRHSGR